MDKVELAGSLVAKCWTSFIDESEKIVKLVKENADFLATTTLDMLNNLFTEKRNNRKFYHEEHGRICQELQRLQEAVSRLRSDYERCTENYQSCKARYEEHKSKGSKRIDEFKDKYLKVFSTGCPKKMALLLCRLISYPFLGHSANQILSLECSGLLVFKTYLILIFLCN